MRLLHALPIVVLPVLLAAVSFPLAGQARRYVEISRQTFDIDGDFDDSIVLATPTRVFNIPALRTVDGIGFEFGTMYTRGAWSLAYLRADPFAPSILGDTVANLRSYGLEAMVFPYLKSAGRFGISPTLRMGVGLTWLKLPGSATEDGVTFEDATYRSLGINLGAGGIVRISGIFHVVVDYTRRFLGFDQVRGLGDSIEISDDVKATADYLKIGAALYLP